MLSSDFTQTLSSTSTDVSGDCCSNYSILEKYYKQQSQLLTNFQRKLLLESIQGELRPEYRRRIEIMLLADTGHSQAQICEALGCSQETARYWIAMAQAGQAHNWNDRPIGRPKMVNEQYLERLKELVNHSPREYGYSFRCWTAEWLSKHLAKEFDIEISDRHINRLLQKLGLSTRQKHSKAEQVTDLCDTKKSGITICNLQSASAPTFLRPFNFIKTGS
jgi:transposase